MADKKTFFGNLLAGAGNAITSGLFGLGSSLLTNKGAKSRQQLADANNIKFWNMQNEYNTPKAQMKRLEDAGLNPALIYGSGATNTGVAGSIAPSKPAPYNIKNPVPLQALMMQAQINNLNAGSKQKEADAAKTLGLTPNLISEAKSKSDIAAQKAIQQGVITGQITEQQQAKTESAMSKARMDAATATYQEAYTAFKINLIKAGIDPSGNVQTTLLKWFTNMFQKTKTKQNPVPTGGLDYRKYIPKNQYKG